MNLPNKLTILRVFMIPLFLWIFLYPPEAVNGCYNYIATLIFIVASATDALDGYIARKYNLVTNFGKFMDPLADKLLVCAALVAMVKVNLLSAIVVIIIISREFIITGFRTVAADAGIVIAASVWGKAKTISQMIMIPYVMLALSGNVAEIIKTILVILVVVLTIMSAVDYIWKNKQVLKA